MTTTPASFATNLASQTASAFATNVPAAVGQQLGAVWTGLTHSFENAFLEARQAVQAYPAYALTPSAPYATSPYSVPAALVPAVPYAAPYAARCQQQYNDSLRRFVGRSPAECAAVGDQSQYGCQPGSTPFRNRCGCGCAALVAPVAPQHVQACTPQQRGLLCGAAGPYGAPPKCGCQVRVVQGRPRLQCTTYANQCAACNDPNVDVYFDGSCPSGL